jgi:hypothetical protein
VAARYTYLWEFLVELERIGEFERHYGPQGTWVALSPYPHVQFMVEDGRVTRADVPDNVSHVVGIHVGMTLREVTRRFPSARVTSHKYDPSGHYIAFSSPNRKTEILAEESGHKIVAIRGQLLSSVEYVEGCL